MGYIQAEHMVNIFCSLNRDTHIIQLPRDNEYSKKVNAKNTSRCQCKAVAYVTSASELADVCTRGSEGSSELIKMATQKNSLLLTCTFKLTAQLHLKQVVL